MFRSWLVGIAMSRSGNVFERKTALIAPQVGGLSGRWPLSIGTFYTPGVEIPSRSLPLCIQATRARSGIQAMGEARGRRVERSFRRSLKRRRTMIGWHRTQGCYRFARQISDWPGPRPWPHDWSICAIRRGCAVSCPSCCVRVCTHW